MRKMHIIVRVTDGDPWEINTHKIQFETEISEEEIIFFEGRIEDLFWIKMKALTENIIESDNYINIRR